MCSIGSERGEPRSSNVVKTGAPHKVLPIETPVLSLDELNRSTGNFGSKALIGEGSYGRVFYAKFSNGQVAAIKKLDTNSSQEPDSDFAAQVEILDIVYHRNECAFDLFYYAISDIFVCELYAVISSFKA